MLEKELKEYSKSGAYPFHMPGHKRQLDFPNPYSMDITEIEGFDNLHHAVGVLADAQERAARLYGADRSFYLVNGSTCGILAAVCAVVPKGAPVLVARNCHKSVYHALELRDARPVYLYPAKTDAGIAGQIAPDEIEALLCRELEVHDTENLHEIGKSHEASKIYETGNPSYRMENLSADMENDRRGQRDRIAAVIITNPTYDGVVSDIRAIAEIAHRYGVPLLVDAAHGAHFGFSECFPENPLRLGADAVVVSIHKTLPAFTQTALLHLKGERISTERVEEFLDIFETSSPSYVLMAGADRCMQIMASDGRRLLDRLAARLEAFYERLRSLRQLHVLRKSNIVGDAAGGSYTQAYDFDESRILIFTDRAGISGVQLADILRTEYGLEMEMACANYVLALATLMDTEEGFTRLGDALLAIDHALPVRNISPQLWDIQPQMQNFSRHMELVMSIAEVREAHRKRIPLEHAAGSISASYLIPYPPGIPLVVPGERIDAQTAAEIRHCRRMGITVEGLMEENSVMVVG